MRSLLLALVTLALTSSIAPAQSLDLDSVPHFLATNEITSATTGKWTFQVPASASRKVQMVSLAVWCEFECELVQTFNATSVSGTSSTPVSLNLVGSTPAFEFYYLSSWSGGSSAAPITVPAKTNFPLKQMIVLAKGQSTAQNYSVAVTMGSAGKSRIYAIAAERR